MDVFDSDWQRSAAMTKSADLPSWQIWHALPLMLATAVGYGLVAWGGLSFLTGATGVAIFWPASGFSAGLAIAIGRSGYAAIGVGTVLGTTVVNLFFERDLATAVGFGLLNAGETLLTARLLELIPERTRAARRVLRALAFFGAAIASTAAAGLGAALMLHGAAPDDSAIFLDVWGTWWLSDLVGIIVIAPLVIALHELATTPELRKGHDWKADVVVLSPFLAVAYHTLGVGFDDGTWTSIVPGAALLPLLLWLSARSQPIVPALAITILAIMMAWFAAAGAGRYGDIRLPQEARILAAQVALGAATLVAQMVMALYADRRLAVLRLKASEMRLAAIADTAPGVIFSAECRPDGTLSFPFVSSASSEMLGISPQHLAAEPSALFDRLDPRHRSTLFDTLRDTEHRATPLAIELPLRNGPSAETWIEIKARCIRDSDQRVVWHGFIQDVTLRRRLVEELGHRTRNLLSVTQAIADHTARNTPPDEFADVLAERLSALAASHEILAAHHWEGAELQMLAKAQLSHLSGLFDRRLLIIGSPVLLQPPAAQVIGMAIHELATNACKHGALATEDGTVTLSWWPPDEDRTGLFHMCWHEQGGTPMRAEIRKGFGSKIILDMPANQLDADIRLEPRDDGLIWSFSAPVENVIRKKDHVTPDADTARGSPAAATKDLRRPPRLPHDRSP